MVQPIVIAGPTASGKSQLAIELAKAVGGEIVCADSRQIYDGMRIGSAGPSADEEASVAHHLYHAVDPARPIDVGQMLGLIDQKVGEVQTRGAVPILVSGSGLHLRCFRFGLSKLPTRNEQLRASLEQVIQAKGTAHLYQQLVQIDPEAAQKISPMDPVRIIRALEIAHMTGKKPSELRDTHFQKGPRIDANWILVWPSKTWLDQRLEARVGLMFDEGLVNEALQLRERLGKEHPLVKTMGYEEALLFADQQLSLADAKKKAYFRHRAYAKRQMTWFKKEPWWNKFDPEIKDLSATVLKIVQ